MKGIGEGEVKKKVGGSMVGGRRYHHVCDTNMVYEVNSIVFCAVNRPFHSYSPDFIAHPP